MGRCLAHKCNKDNDRKYKETGLQSCNHVGSLLKDYDLHILGSSGNDGKSCSKMFQCRLRTPPPNPENFRRFGGHIAQNCARCSSSV